MSIVKIIRDGLLDYAENGVYNAINEYKMTKRDCTIISLVVFAICGISLLLKAFVF